MALLTVDSPHLAMSQSHGQHMKGHTGQITRPGENILNATVDSHQFAYYLITMRKSMAKMQHQSQTTSMQPSHHLMVYVTKPDGQLLDQAKVYYFVEGPDGAKQKQMGMAMGGGFGANFHLGTNGAYVIKTSAFAGDKTLRHQFTYEIN
jgi:hypothetical protein